MKTMIVIMLAGLFMAVSGRAGVTLPPAEQMTLDNGLTVVVIEQHELPLVSMRLTFRAGSIHDPGDKPGLANFCNEMLMRGTSTRSARRIAEEIAFGGGSLYNYITREQGCFAGDQLVSENDYFPSGTPGP